MIRASSAIKIAGQTFHAKHTLHTALGESVVADHSYVMINDKGDS